VGERIIFSAISFQLSALNHFKASGSELHASIFEVLKLEAGSSKLEA
jgi:hypothetical protein